ncbi:hypothetical protein IMSAG025_01350 [Muribaculaceae bacterium]|nr:hypothetical protein IMSAG025_01350 [Muribaculaceae bacterium]
MNYLLCVVFFIPATTVKSLFALSPSGPFVPVLPGNKCSWKGNVFAMNDYCSIVSTILYTG